MKEKIEQLAALNHQAELEAAKTVSRNNMQQAS